MKKLSFSLLLVSLLVIVLSIGAISTEKSNSTDVTIGLAQQGCYIQLDVHENLYLGTIENFSEGDTINSEDIGNGKKKIKVKTDCANLSLTAQATSFSLPPEHTESAEVAISRFGIKTTEDTDYTEFGGLNNSILLKDITGSSAPAGQATENVIIDYKYTVGEQDVEGSYTAILQYTATTE